MCVVSMIYDHYRHKPDDYWDKLRFDDFMKLIEAAKKYDKMTDQPDCESAEKGKFIEVVRERVSGKPEPSAT